MNNCETIEKPNNITDKTFNKIKFYNMNNKYRGYALIFNHEYFDTSLQSVLSKRKGTEIDCDKLQNCLKKMGFKLYVYQNLTKTDLIGTLKKFSQKDHSQNDCFFVAVLTHGSESGKLYAFDDYYKYEDLWSPFYISLCPSLKDKPKIFVIQACQGILYDHGITLDTQAINSYNNNNNNSGLDSSIHENKEETYSKYKDGYFLYQLLQEPDFLVVYSTIPGYFSWRNTTYGSWFIQELCKELETNAYEDNLLHLLTKILRHVAVLYESYVPDNTDKDKKKQVPCFSHTLLKILQFKEKSKFYNKKQCNLN